MPSEECTSNGSPADLGRRRFLVGAVAGLAPAPLVAGLAACSSDAPAVQSPAAGGTSTGRATRGAGPVAAATTVTGRRTLGSLEVSSTGLGCQTMPGNL